MVVKLRLSLGKKKEDAVIETSSNKSGGGNKRTQPAANGRIVLNGTLLSGVSKKTLEERIG